MTVLVMGSCVSYTAEDIREPQSLCPDPEGRAGGKICVEYCVGAPGLLLIHCDVCLNYVN